MSGHHTPTTADSETNTPPPASKDKDRGTTELTLISIGPGRVQGCRVLSGRGRSTMDSVRLLDQRPGHEKPTFLCSFMLPAQGGVATRLNYAFSGDLLASGNLTALEITGTRERDDGKTEDWTWPTDGKAAKKAPAVAP